MEKSLNFCYYYAMNKNQIMKVFKPFLWSYDLKKMDLKNDKVRIITNVLYWGTQESTKMLFKIYDLKSIKGVVARPMPGEWNKKSLNFWSLILDVKPQVRVRKVS